MGTVRYVIDREAVAAEVARTRATLDQGYGRWFARQVAFNMAVFYVIVLVLRWSELAQVAAWPAWKLGATFVLPLVAAVGLAWWTGRRTFSEDNLDLDRRMLRIAEDLRALGGPGWIRRSAIMGLGLGAAIGIPVGALMMLAWRPETMPGVQRALTIPVFVGMTLVWCVPMVFLLRWLSLLALKRMVKTVDE